MCGSVVDLRGGEVLSRKMSDYQELNRFLFLLIYKIPMTLTMWICKIDFFDRYFRK